MIKLRHKHEILISDYLELIRCLHAGLEPGDRSSGHMEGVHRRADALRHIELFSEGRRLVQTSKLPIAAIDREFDISAIVKPLRRHDLHPTDKRDEWWISLRVYRRLPMEPTPEKPWLVIVEN